LNSLAYHLNRSGNYEEEANSKGLQPGDVVHVTGVPWTQTIDLQSGDTTVINGLNVSNTTLPKQHRTPKAPPLEKDIKQFWIDNT
jgi:hypothetical protein